MESWNTSTTLVCVEKSGLKQQKLFSVVFGSITQSVFY